MRILLSVCLAAVLGGCSISQLPTWLSPHAIDIQQGNAITQDQVDKLRPGMTRQQVQAIVGTPLLKDMFHANRWDYTYQHYRKHQLIGNAHLTLYFKGEVLERIEGQALPDSTRQDTTPPQS